MGGIDGEVKKKATSDQLSWVWLSLAVQKTYFATPQMMHTYLSLKWVIVNLWVKKWISFRGWEGRGRYLLQRKFCQNNFVLTPREQLTLCMARQGHFDHHFQIFSRPFKRVHVKFLNCLSFPKYQNQYFLKNLNSLPPH